MEEIWSVFIKWAIPFICGGLITGLITAIKNIKHKNDVITEALTKRNDALCAGVQCLLRSEIIKIHDKAIADGYCPVYKKESLKRIYTAYHNLDGNDIATKLFKDVMELPEYK